MKKETVIKTPIWTAKKLTFTEIQNINIKKVTEDLTLKIENSLAKYGLSKPPEVIKLYTIFGNKIIVPRFYPDAKLVNELYAPVQTDCFFGSIDLISENQRVIFQYFEKYFAKPNGMNLILSTGQGKTYLAAKLASVLKLKTLIVCPNSEIARTWIQVLKGICKPALMGDGKKEQGPVTVGIINSLLKQPKTWFDFDFVIYDEVTEYLSEKRRVIFQLTAKPYLLGLTATPDVKKKRIFELYVGMCFYAQNLRGFSNQEIPWKATVKAIKYYGTETYTKKIVSKLNMTSAVEMDKQFAQDPDRNELIVSEIIRLAKQKSVYVFVSQCDLAYKLSELLTVRSQRTDGKQTNTEFVPNIYFLTGTDKTASVQELCEIKHNFIVFTTYKFSSKGISVPKMSSLVLCQPRMADTEQTIGRILRIGGDISETREIIDIIDMNTTLKNQFSTRKAIYTKLGFPIVYDVVKI